MNRMHKTVFSILAIAMLFSMAIVTASAGSNSEKDKNVLDLEKQLDKNVKLYNQAVIKGSLDDVAACVENIDQVIDELYVYEMDVEFTETSDVYITSDNEMMPATISVQVVASTETSADRSIAETRKSGSVDENKIERLNQVYGTNISVGEYMELFHPEIQDQMSQESIEKDYNTQMVWPVSTSNNNNSIIDNSITTLFSIPIVDYPRMMK